MMLKGKEVKVSVVSWINPDNGTVTLSECDKNGTKITLGCTRLKKENFLDNSTTNVKLSSCDYSKYAIKRFFYTVGDLIEVDANMQPIRNLSCYRKELTYI